MPPPDSVAVFRIRTRSGPASAAGAGDAAVLREIAPAAVQQIHVAAQVSEKNSRRGRDMTHQRVDA